MLEKRSKGKQPKKEHLDFLLQGKEKYIFGMRRRPSPEETKDSHDQRGGDTLEKMEVNPGGPSGNKKRDLGEGSLFGEKFQENGYNDFGPQGEKNKED